MPPSSTAHRSAPDHWRPPTRWCRRAWRSRRTRWSPECQQKFLVNSTQTQSQASPLTQTSTCASPQHTSTAKTSVNLSTIPCEHRTMTQKIVILPVQADRDNTPFDTAHTTTVETARANGFSIVEPDDGEATAIVVVRMLDSADRKSVV